ncbi:MAG: hypothetical protein FWG01_02050 [Betaproteobacteria bacterium]|nr:hypothetical protein [Betaproteobacteria bacterium]
MKPPLILNFDNSAGLMPGAAVVDLTGWQETIRFGCSMKNFRHFCQMLEGQLPKEYGTVFLGSGDYHHLSYYLIERIADRLFPSPFQVVVFDNHPDNMRFPFGIHCGSWVSHVAKLPQVSHVHVLGITSEDIGLKHAWENRLRPLFAGKLTYWCTDVSVGWARALGLGHAFRRFDSPDELVAAFVDKVRQSALPVYLSIDKDVLSEESVQTNWDQGRFQEEHLAGIISELKGRIIGSDITGEVSTWTYASRWKRYLSQMDGQESVSESEMILWQKAQQELNRRLLQMLKASLF